MDNAAGEEFAITRDELGIIIEEQTCSAMVKTRLRNLVESFPNPRSFREAKDAELRRHGRCGKTMLDLVEKVKERCWFLEKHREERFRLNSNFAEFMDERDRCQARRLEALNPVFTVGELESAALMMSNMKLEVIDLRRLNDFRYAMTFAQREEMNRRRKEQEEERMRRDAEEKARLERERAEREAKAKPAKERQKEEKNGGK